MVFVKLWICLFQQLPVWNVTLVHTVELLTELLPIMDVASFQTSEFENDTGGSDTLLKRRHKSNSVAVKDYQLSLLLKNIAVISKKEEWR